MNVQKLTAYAPKLQSFNGKLTSEWRLDDETHLFLDHRLAKWMRTIETGAGVSTVLFASKGVKHTCAVPDQELVDRIKRYCDEIGVSHVPVNFVVAGSEYALPSMKGETFDGWILASCFQGVAEQGSETLLQ